MRDCGKLISLSVISLWRVSIFLYDVTYLGQEGSCVSTISLSASKKLGNNGLTFASTIVEVYI